MGMLEQDVLKSKWMTEHSFFVCVQQKKKKKCILNKSYLNDNM